MPPQAGAGPGAAPQPATPQGGGQAQPQNGQTDPRMIAQALVKSNPAYWQKNPRAFVLAVQKIQTLQGPQQKAALDAQKADIQLQKVTGDFDAKMAKIQQQADQAVQKAQSAQQVAEIRAEAARQVADIATARATTVAGIAAGSREKVAGENNDTKKEIATDNNTTKKDLQTGKDTAAGQRNDATNASRERIAQWKAANTEKVAALKIDAQKSLAAGKDLTDDQVEKIAEARSHGDTSVMQLGMSQGQRGKVLALAADKAKQRGSTLQAEDAGYRGTQAAAGVVGRTAGSVAVGANEIAPLAPKIESLAKKLNTSQYPTINAVENAVRSKTGNADVVQLNSYIQTLKNAYQQISARGGRMTDAQRKINEKLVDGSMPLNQLSAAIDAMKTEASIVKGATAGAMKDVTSGGAAPAASGSVPQIKNDADYDALPPGTTFTAPDGSTRTKPGGQGAANPSSAPGGGQMPKLGVLPGTIELDASIAPKVPKGAPRPFAPGEMVENPNGGWSSEITNTVQMPDGKWSVVPSLWIVDGKPTRVSEDQAVEYAMKSGLPFQRFDSEGAAEKFSQAREDTWHKVGRKGARSVPPLWGSQ